MKKVIFCYVPVPHNGFKKLFDRYPDADIILISRDFVLNFNEKMAGKMRRTFNALEASDSEASVKGMYSSRLVSTISSFDQLKGYDEIIIPKGDIYNLFEPQLAKLGSVLTIETSFLMWDWSTVMAKKNVPIETETTKSPLHRTLMLQAILEAEKSSDWWRKVGAVLCAKNGTQFFGYNCHMPDSQTPYINCDPRSNLNPGEDPHICTAIHAEVSVIAQAAGSTDSIKGADLYVTTFPCHNCARPIVMSGIKTVYFKEGYSSLDAKEILDEGGVKLVKVLFG